MRIFGHVVAAASAEHVIGLAATFKLSRAVGKRRSYLST
jgi:hypothetical protein